VLVALGMCAVLSNAWAQEQRDMGHGAAVIKRSLQLIEATDSTQADALLATVHRSDSLYERAVYIRMQLATYRDRYEDALVLAEQGAGLQGALLSDLLTIRAGLLFDLKRFTACVAACDSLIERFPGRARGHHLKALALWELGERGMATQQLMANARRFPYHRDTHAMIARKAADQGYVSLGALAASMALVVRFDDSGAEGMLTLVDELLAGNHQGRADGSDFGDPERWVELDQIIKSKVAMDARYKVKPDLSFAFCRQSHLLFTEVLKMEHEEGTWGAFYLPVVKAIMNNDLFEGYVYSALTSSSLDKVKALGEKNKSKVTEFRSRIATSVEADYVTFPEPGMTEPAYHAYYDDADLSGYGPLNSAKNGRAGTWTFFHANGAKSAAGTYLPTGEKTGVWWNWHDTGVPSSQAAYEKGEMTGPFITYHTNGAMRDSCMLRNGNREGRCCAYRPSGGISTCKEAVKNVWSGPVEEYHPAGAIHWRYTLKDEKTDGKVEQFYTDGSTQFTGSYALDTRTGTWTEYHPDGQRSEERTFVDGAATGPLTIWHGNGTVRTKGNLNKGSRTGEFFEYDKWGTPRERYNYDDQGRTQGIQESMDDRGHVYMRTEHNRDLLMRYTYFDKANKVLSEGTRSKGKFNLVGYSSDGRLRVKGTYLDEGLKDGKWEYFYPDGTLDSEENMDKGSSVGEQKYFGTDGTLTRKFTTYEQNGKTYERYEEYYASGAVKERGYRQDRTYEGVYTKYAPDGTVLSEEYYVDGERSGWQHYYDASGMLVYTERIENGALMERTSHDDKGVKYEHIRVPVGAFVLETHYPSGKVSLRAELMNGRFHGKVTWYYPNGSTEVTANFLDDERHGLWTSFHPNGKKRTELNYRMGTIHGSSQEWHPSGARKSEFNYRNGSIEGTSTELHENGRTAFVRDYSNGVLHGRHISHDVGGTPQMVRFYHKGTLIGHASINADGSFTDTIPADPGVAVLKTTFPSGGPAREMNYRNGDLNGAFKEYHANGKLMEESQWRLDQAEGTTKEYYPSGQLHRATPYVDGLIHGEAITYHENGKVKETITYRHGVKQGAWTLHDSTGKVVTTYKVRNDDVVEMVN
jgi:antitoxin component YwqK of YwqJK toxin-antitoxin module